jgi:hypothetical protein
MLKSCVTTMAELGATWLAGSGPLSDGMSTTPLLLVAAGLLLYALLQGRSENDDDDSSPGGGLMQPVA